MVSLLQTSKKYWGEIASSYDTRREKQIRWHEENKLVASMLEGVIGGTVLDVPVGTGRFFALYKSMGIKAVGVDCSEDMLALARLKNSDVPVELGDATALRFKNKMFDTVVCIRFLELIDEIAMRLVISELCRMAKKSIVLTIRLGKKYVPESNTATHDENKFIQFVSDLGWKIDRRESVFKVEWYVMKLSPISLHPS